MNKIEEVKQFWDNSPLPLINWGEEYCSPNHEYGGRRSYMLIHFILEGYGGFNNFKKNWPLKSGDSFIVFPDTRNLYKASMDQPWHYFWLGFNPIYQFLFEKAGITRENPVLRMENICEVYSKFIQLTPYSTARTAAQQLKNQTILDQILMLCLEANNENINTGAPQKITQKDHVQSMINFIDENFDHPIKVFDVLQFIGLERSYASRLFKAYKKQSIGGYICSRRMKHAASLIEKGAAVKEAAYSSGYRDYNYFLKRFKREFKQTPGSFVENLKQ